MAFMEKEEKLSLNCHKIPFLSVPLTPVCGVDILGHSEMCLYSSASHTPNQLYKEGDVQCQSLAGLINL